MTKGRSGAYDLRVVDVDSKTSEFRVSGQSYPDPRKDPKSRTPNLGP